MSGPTPYRWPDGRSCAAVLSFDFDAETPYLWNNRNQLTDVLGEPEQRRFGPRQGVHRILDVLRGLELKASFYVPGVVADRYPDAVARIAEEGHEIGLHGWLHERVDELSADEMEDTIGRGAAAVARAAGRPAIGYRSPSWEMTPATFTVLQRLGVRYDSSLMGYDHPYWVGEMPEIPVSWFLDDAPYYRYAGRGDTRPPAYPEALNRAWEEELEGCKRFGGLFLLTMHPWLSGRPGRIAALERMVRRHRDDDRIWWCTAAEAAEHHRTTHPGDFREAAVPARLPDL